MAKKEPSQPKTDQDIAADLLTAAFRIAARGDWPTAGLALLAREAKLPLSAVFGILSDKDQILSLMSRWADTALLGEPPLSPTDGSERERLFDVLYRRLESLQPWRHGIARLLADRKTDPLIWFKRALGGRQMQASVSVLARQAGVSLCPFQNLGLIWVYGYSVTVWLQDETPDQGPTMAALDRALATWERVGSPNRVKNIALTRLFRTAKTE
jgi:ubiquinone biosynthesis protein COQ9